MDMRQPSDQEKKEFSYITTFVIDVKRTDNKPLTDEENAMVDQMRIASEEAIAKIMVKNGNARRKHLGTKRRIY